MQRLILERLCQRIFRFPQRCRSRGLVRVKMCIRDSGSTEEHLTVTQFKVQAEQQRLEAVTAQVADAEPVSYTHLDVYKRQERETPNFSDNCSWESPACFRAIFNFSPNVRCV